MSHTPEQLRKYAECLPLADERGGIAETQEALRWAADEIARLRKEAEEARYLLTMAMAFVPHRLTNTLPWSNAELVCADSLQARASAFLARTGEGGGG